MQNAAFERRVKQSGLNIVGLSADYHDSACSIMKDGVLLAAAQEERFSRVKNDKEFPRRAFRYCLQAASLTIDQVDCIAYYEDPCLKLGRQLWMGMVPNLPAPRREAILRRAAKDQPEEAIRNILGYEGHIEIVEHHLSHAASSYFFSGFDEAAILTVDGVGDWSTTTYGWGRGSQIERFEQVDFPDSLGLLYSAITSYLGFEVNEGEYKVMGLAPYGSPLYVNQIRKLIHVGSEGQYRLDMKYFGFLNEDSMYTDELCSLLGGPARVPDSEIHKFHMDVAKSVQTVLEEVLLDKLNYLHQRVPSENLCMAGGVALNVVANRRCLKEGSFKRLFVQPAAGDSGGAVGAAAMAHLRLTGHAPQQRLEHVYLGPSNSSQDVYLLLKNSSAKFRDFRQREPQLVRYVAERLIEGKIVAWCQGQMEFGPRALGARSILADPRRPEMRDRVNQTVKMRETFRPFAPAVLEGKAKEHFDLDHSSPFMLETCQVCSSIALPAITHVDGSARVQTVSSDTNPRFYALLEQFDRLTGCPMLLNTSFNVRGEPIVCTAVEAIMCFVQCNIDVLVVEDFVMERSQIPAIWELQARQRLTDRRRGGEVGHLVYTLL